MVSNKLFGALALGLCTLTVAAPPMLISQAAARSPVPVESAHHIPQQPFRGFNARGADWRINIKNQYRAENSVNLRLDDGSQWNGTLHNGGSVLDTSSRFVVLSGQVRNGLAMLPVTVEITLGERCKVKGSRSMNKITVYGTGDRPLRGCGYIS